MGIIESFLISCYGLFKEVGCYQHVKYLNFSSHLLLMKIEIFVKIL